MYNIARGSVQNKQTDTTMFDRLNQRFVSAVKWNMAETVMYHTLFIAHQFSLYAVVGSEDYGKAGALFSFSFLLVALLQGALEVTLIPYIQSFSSSKDHFKILLNRYIAPQVGIMLSAPLFLWIFKLSGWITKLNSYSWSTCLLIGIFIAGQSIHKILRRLLQLLFLNKHTASIEVATLIMYITLFWSAYFLSVPFGVPLLLLPYIAATCITVTSFTIFIKNYYKQLPQCSNTPLNTKNFRTIQMYGIINQTSRSLFSGNFLIPLFAFNAGFKEAGIATLIKYGTYTLTIFIQKLCAPAGALFGHGTTLTETQKQHNFIKSLRLFFSIILFFGLTFGLYCLHNLSSISHTTLLYVCFFLLIYILEHLFTLYEKFFIAQNKAFILTACNIISCILSGYTFYMLYTSSFLCAILLSFVLRASLFVLLSWIIFSTSSSKKAPSGAYQAGK